MGCLYLFTDHLLWRNFLSPQCRNCSRDPDTILSGKIFHRNVSLVRKIRLENVVGVGFDAMEKVVVGSVEQVGDDRHIIATVLNRAVCCGATAVRRRALARPRWRRILNARDNCRAENIVQRRGRGTMRARGKKEIRVSPKITILPSGIPRTDPLATADACRMTNYELLRAKFSTSGS